MDPVEKDDTEGSPLDKTPGLPPKQAEECQSTAETLPTVIPEEDTNSEIYEEDTEEGDDEEP